MEEILKMIENVDPSDTAKLDEIDARVYEFLTGKETHQDFYTKNGARHTGWFRNNSNGTQTKVPEYTRSRDALKAIRPGGWEWYLAYYNDGVRFGCAKDSIGTDQMESVSLATEELAELAVIIQAINHERKESDNERE